jgi:endonuclease/exonuclease/phosphatase family metal-dependent hydrolase
MSSHRTHCPIPTVSHMMNDMAMTPTNQSWPRPPQLTRYSSHHRLGADSAGVVESVSVGGVASVETSVGSSSLSSSSSSLLSPASSSSSFLSSSSSSSSSSCGWAGLAVDTNDNNWSSPPLEPVMDGFLPINQREWISSLLLSSSPTATTISDTLPLASTSTPSATAALPSVTATTTVAAVVPIATSTTPPLGLLPPSLMGISGAETKRSSSAGAACKPLHINDKCGNELTAPAHVRRSSSMGALSSSTKSDPTALCRMLIQLATERQRVVCNESDVEVCQDPSCSSQSSSSSSPSSSPHTTPTGNDTPFSPFSPASSSSVYHKPSFLRRLVLPVRRTTALTADDDDTDDEDSDTGVVPPSLPLAPSAPLPSRPPSYQPTPTMIMPHLPTTHSPDILITASFNIHSCVGEDHIYDVDRVGNYLASLDADIIGLQEVEVNMVSQYTRSWSAKHKHNQVQLLSAAARLGHTRFAPLLQCEYDPLTNTSHKGSGHGHFGCAILSRYPVIDQRLQVYKSYTGKPSRNLLAIRVQPPSLAPHGSVWFATTHLGVQISAQEQAQQAKELIMYLDHLHRETNTPIILSGDFNATQWIHSSKTLSNTRLSFGSLVDLWKSYGLGDMASCGIPSISTLSGCSFFRADYLTCCERTLGSLSCVGTGSMFNAVSDHKPLVAVFRKRTADNNNNSRARQRRNDNGTGAPTPTHSGMLMSNSGVPTPTGSGSSNGGSVHGAFPPSHTPTHANGQYHSQPPHHHQHSQYQVHPQYQHQHHAAPHQQHMAAAAPAGMYVDTRDDKRTGTSRVETKNMSPYYHGQPPSSHHSGAPQHQTASGHHGYSSHPHYSAPVPHINGHHYTGYQGHAPSSYGSHPHAHLVANHHQGYGHRSGSNGGNGMPPMSLPISVSSSNISSLATRPASSRSGQSALPPAPLSVTTASPSIHGMNHNNTGNGLSSVPPPALSLHPPPLPPSVASSSMSAAIRRQAELDSEALGASLAALSISSSSTSSSTSSPDCTPTSKSGPFGGVTQVASIAPRAYQAEISPRVTLNGDTNSIGALAVGPSSLAAVPVSAVAPRLSLSVNVSPRHSLSIAEAPTPLANSTPLASSLAMPPTPLAIMPDARTPSATSLAGRMEVSPPRPGSGNGNHILSPAGAVPPRSSSSQSPAHMMLSAGVSPSSTNGSGASATPTHASVAPMMGLHGQMIYPHSHSSHGHGHIHSHQGNGSGGMTGLSILTGATPRAGTGPFGASTPLANAPTPLASSLPSFYNPEPSPSSNPMYYQSFSPSPIHYLHHRAPTYVTPMTPSSADTPRSMEPPSPAGLPPPDKPPALTKSPGRTLRDVTKPQDRDFI